MMARGLTLIEVAVLSGVSLDTVRKLDRLEPDSLGQLTVRKLLKIAQFFEVAPSDLLPYLNVAVKKKKPSV
jgi:transcriptional regulator with XRE-family HTH domain